MSSFQAEYKQRKLKISGILTISIDNTDPTLKQDYTQLENIVSDKIVDVITEYLSKDETVKMIDIERYRTKYL